MSKFANIQKGIIAVRATHVDFDIKDKSNDSPYRQMLFMITCKYSTRDMTNQQRRDVITHLGGSSFTRNPSTSSGQGNTSRYKRTTSRKLVMMWADIRAQGKLKTEDARLEDWLKNQYDKPNPDWMTEAERSKAISRLNTWKKRFIKPRVK